VITEVVFMRGTVFVEKLDVSEGYAKVEALRYNFAKLFATSIKQGLPFDVILKSSVN
jgi:hypothetical protein